MPSACRPAFRGSLASWVGCAEQLQLGCQCSPLSQQTGYALDAYVLQNGHKQRLAFLLFRRSVNCSSMCEIIISISGLRILTAICVRSQQATTAAAAAATATKSCRLVHKLATCNWQLSTRNSQLATCNWQLAIRNSVGGFTWNCKRLSSCCCCSYWHRQVDTQYGY